MDDSNMRVSLMLSTQVGMLGNITPNIRMITCGWKEEEILIRAVFDGLITEENKELIELIATEVVADFKRFYIKTEYIRLDAPSSLAQLFLTIVVYLRFEYESD